MCFVKMQIMIIILIVVLLLLALGRGDASIPYATRIRDAMWLLEASRGLLEAFYALA